jgi:leucyl/phenylalanyl-tRNA---protein transferase
MVVTEFPPVETADSSGLLAIGGDLDPETLLLAYSRGIFPWPYDEKLLAWYAPPQRAVLFLSELHIPRSLRKAARRSHFQLYHNRALSRVIAECASIKNRPGQRKTWITKRMQEAYQVLGELGFCHSFESYNGEHLVGGLYGLLLGRMFAGESMFYREENASKLAFIFLTDFLLSSGVEWIDCQVLTPTFEQFGARMIERKDFSKLLTEALTV